MIPETAFRKLRQEGFEASLGYMVKPSLPLKKGGRGRKSHVAI
jgi:hypothetical protein